MGKMKDKYIKLEDKWKEALGHVMCKHYKFELSEEDLLFIVAKHMFIKGMEYGEGNE